MVGNEPSGPGAGEDVTAENTCLRLNLALSRALVAKLSSANAELAERLAAADARIAELAERLAAADTRIAELTARLSQDSSNSSRPPSSDGYRKQPVRGPGGGRRGKRPGAPGAHLAQVAVPDEVVVHAPPTCGGCGQSLGEAEVVEVVRRQVFDLPPLRLRVTEHQAQRRRCGCGTTTAAGFPDGVTAPACYGTGVRALVAYLAVQHHLPVDRLAQLLADCLGAPVATGSVAAIVAEAAERLAPFGEAVRAALAAAPVVCFDETGARAAGSLHWLHTASTPELTLLTAHAKRGVEAMDAAGVLPAFRGTAVHDGWTPYRRYDDVTHALCNAHHLRELTAVAESGQDWAEYLIDTLVTAKRHVEAARAAGAERLDPALEAAIRGRYDGHLAQGHAANPSLPGRGRARSKAANLLARLERYRDDVLRFTVDFAVPFDNNLAERDIRMAKLQQKISGCWRTLAGAETFCAIRSYVSSARKQRRHVLDALRQAFNGNPWLPSTA